LPNGIETKQEKKMKVTDRTELMVSALNVMNRSIQHNEDHFPYKQICAVGEKLIGGKNMGVAVYAEDPDTPMTISRSAGRTTNLS
jgi:hypothetical protein